MLVAAGAARGRPRRGAAAAGTERLCKNAPEIVAQLHWAVESELAVSLQDLLLRRTGSGPGRASASTAPRPSRSGWARSSVGARGASRRSSTPTRHRPPGLRFRSE